MDIPSLLDYHITGRKKPRIPEIHTKVKTYFF